MASVMKVKAAVGTICTLLHVSFDVSYIKKTTTSHIHKLHSWVLFLVTLFTRLFLSWEGMHGLGMRLQAPLLIINSTQNRNSLALVAEKKLIFKYVHGTWPTRIYLASVWIPVNAALSLLSLSSHNSKHVFIPTHESFLPAETRCSKQLLCFSQGLLAMTVY